MIRMSALVGRTQFNALCDLLRGGVLLLCSGDPPLDQEASVPEKQIGVRVSVGNCAVRVADDGESAKLGPFDTTLVEHEVIVRWFQVRTADQQVLLDGTIGRGSGDLRLPRTDLLPGDRVTIEEMELTRREPVSE